MPDIIGKARAEMIISARIIRENGAVEDLGVITKNKVSFWSKFRKLLGG